MQPTPHAPSGLRALIASPAGAALLGLVSAGALYALVAHTAHVMSLLPYAIFLLCPLMHLFMMRGHGRHGSGGDDQEHRH